MTCSSFCRETAVLLPFKVAVVGQNYIRPDVMTYPVILSLSVCVSVLHSCQYDRHHMDDAGAYSLGVEVNDSIV